MKRKPLKKKKCRICKREFQPFSTTSATCGLFCSIADAKQKRELRDAKLKKSDRDALRKRRDALLTRGDYARRAQRQFNSFILLRDFALGCISCNKGADYKGRFHASHYRSIAAAPEHRYNPLNVAKACAPCNLFLSGNISEYRIGLINKIGLEAVMELEGPCPPKQYTIDDLKAIAKDYAARCRELKKKLQMC